jgi:nicotinamidase-related amidase
MISLDEKRRILNFNERVDPAATALVVIDVQNDFVSPQGVCGQVGDDVAAAHAMVSRLIPLIESARKAGVLIIFMRTIYDEPVLSPALAEQYERRRYPNSICLTGTPGAEFVDGVHTRDEPNEMVLIKHRYSAFWGSPIDLALRTNGIRTVVLTGVATEVCVESTARDAFFQDYQVVMVDDCVSCYSPERHNAALTVVARSFGVVAGSKKIRTVWDAAVPGKRNWHPDAKGARALTESRQLLEPKHTALLLINLQRDFLGPSSVKNFGPPLSQIIPAARDLLEQARGTDCMVIHAPAAYEPSEHTQGLIGASDLAKLCRPGSEGAQFVDGFGPERAEQVVRCSRFSAFADTPLALLLRSNGIRTIVIAGVTTECAVESTVRDAAARDYYIVVAKDGVASADPAVHEASMQTMARYFSVPAWTSEIVTHWTAPTRRHVLA